MQPTQPIRIRNNEHQLWPTWFSIENYRCLALLTVEEFINELDFRLRLCDLASLPSGRKPRDDKKWAEVERGFVVIADQLTEEANSRQSGSVTALNHIDLLVASENFRLDNQEELLQQEPEYLLPLHNQQKGLLIGVDITADNDSILKDIENLLNCMRLKVNVAEPRSRSNRKSNEKSFKKLFTYKAIPYLDLLLYSLSHKQLNDQHWAPLSLSQGALINLLFEGSIDIEQFKKTHNVFYQNNLLNPDFLKPLITNIRSERELLSRKIGLL
ncbi:DUF6387 family protein [Shewanella nanhaiensis]|uniref:Uncharacterized protein n=1 Tax=Shewanella nanhaiensis TaxID=2864872 RepID=A0ABS7EA43_9GAMM|nr:DUF6387 family protein [Shewanella nanhaiensis]MBW8186581.1 hypothetical protein [Shewanella nanhaiensis]